MQHERETRSHFYDDATRSVARACAAGVQRQNVKCEFPELNMGTPLPCGPHLHPCP